MIVLDASAAVSLIVGGGSVAQALADRIARGGARGAPHLLDVEFASALRALTRRGRIMAEEAPALLSDLDALGVTRYPHMPLLARVYALRDALTAYDAAYVALAEALDCPLITCDARLGRAGASDVRVEVFDG